MSNLQKLETVNDESETRSLDDTIYRARYVLPSASSLQPFASAMAPLSGVPDFVEVLVVFHQLFLLPTLVLVFLN